MGLHSRLSMAFYGGRFKEGLKRKVEIIESIVVLASCYGVHSGSALAGVSTSNRVQQICRCGAVCECE